MLSASMKPTLHVRSEGLAKGMASRGIIHSDFMRSGLQATLARQYSDSNAAGARTYLRVLEASHCLTHILSAGSPRRFVELVILGMPHRAWNCRSYPAPAPIRMAGWGKVYQDMHGGTPQQPFAMTIPYRRHRPR